MLLMLWGGAFDLEEGAVRTEGQGGQGVQFPFPPDFAYNPIPIRGSDYAHHITVNFRFKEVWFKEYFRFKQEFHFPKMKK